MEIEAYKKGNKYLVQAWVFDYGIFDADKGKFVGTPLNQSEAMTIVKFLNDNSFNLKKQKKRLGTTINAMH